jgi:hypothetical protein
MIEFGRDKMAFWRPRRQLSDTVAVEIESGITVNEAAGVFEAMRDQSVRVLTETEKSKVDPHNQTTVARNNVTLNEAVTIPGQRNTLFMSDFVAAVIEGSNDLERFLLNTGSSREAVAAFRTASPLTPREQMQLTDNALFDDAGLRRLLVENALSPREHRHYFGRKHWRR